MDKAYMTPPVPAGFSHLSGTWDTGYVIRRDSDRSQFVWVPVGALPADGLYNGSRQSFGVRGYGYSGKATAQSGAPLQAQAESILKHGGFYISRYCLTADENGTLHSLPGTLPLTFINRADALTAAEKLVRQSDAVSHLPYAAEMDSAIAWLIQSGDLTPETVSMAAARRDGRTHRDKVLPTDSDPALYGRGIYDLAGTVDEWTQESTDGAFLWGCQPCAWPTTSRCYFVPYACYTYTGFRAALRLA